MDMENFTTRTREFIVQLKTGIEITDIDENTELIDSRIIDSLSFQEFLLFLEDTFGAPITLELGEISVFRSISSIYHHLYLKGESTHV